MRKRLRQLVFPNTYVPRLLRRPLVRVLCLAFSVFASTSALSGDGAKSNQHPRLVAGKDLVELRDIDGLTASPDGSAVAFQIRQASVVDDGYSASWYVLDVGKSEDPKEIGSSGVVRPRPRAT